MPAIICANSPLWSVKNLDDSLNKWVTILVSLPDSKYGDYKLILEGTIPSGNPNAKICVDNITSSAEPCEVVKAELSKSAPSIESWVEIFGMTFSGALALGLTIPIAVIVVCMFERKRRRGKKSDIIIRHTDDLDQSEAIASGSGCDTNSMPQRFSNTQVGIGHPGLMSRTMSTPVVTNGQGGSYTMGKRNGCQSAMPVRSNSGQMSHTIGRGSVDGGWMMSSQQGNLTENDEYTIDSDYTAHRQTSVPATVYLPMGSNVNQMDQEVQQALIYQNRSLPQVGMATNNPFGTPMISGVNVSGQDSRSLGGSHVSNFRADESRATPGLPFYPPRYEEAMGFKQGNAATMDEKPPLLPPRIPDGSGSSGGGGVSCSSPLPPAPPPLPLAGHPSSGRFIGGNEQ